jgi:MFS family permease
VRRFSIQRPTIHYAWIIAATAMIVVLGAVGLARFAFAVVLPAMTADLSLSYREQGILGGSYFLGYFVVVVLMTWFGQRLGPKRMCTSGLAVVSAGLLGMVIGPNFATLSASYFVVGLGSGSAFIGAMSLPALWFHPSHRARGAGIVAAGAGVGILVSGLFVPHVPAAFKLADWQLIWLTFAVVTALFCGLALLVLRDRPAELGCTPYGEALKQHHPGADSGIQQGATRGNWRFLVHLGTIYALFGATALTFATFIVTTMVDSFSIPPSTAGLLWAGVGGISIFSGFLFGKISDRFGHRVGMVCALSVQAIAYTLLAGGTGITGLYISITLFGLSAWSMPTIVAAATGDYLGAERSAAGFAALTLMFSVGQVIGPAGAGLLADSTGSFKFAYAIAASLNVLAVLLCFFLRPPPQVP